MINMVANRSRVFCAGLLVYALQPACQAKDSSDFQFSGNLGLVSDYVSRGLSLNWGEPALQGGLEITHGSGAYASLWASQITSRYYAGGHAELDLYGGYRGALGDMTNYDIGLGAYFYPGANYREVAPKGTYPAGRYDTVEALFSVTHGWLNLKYSYCLTDYYGYNSSTVPVAVWSSGVTGGVEAGQRTGGSAYAEANANFELGSGYSIALHAGHQRVTHGHNLSYSDFKLSVSRTFDNGWSAALAVSDTRGAEIYDRFVAIDGSGMMRDIGGVHIVASVSKVF